MRAAIPPSWYVDEAVFQREQAGVFAACWHFAGMMHDLARPDDFVTLRLAGRSIVVQNFDGALRAFENVCRHRHSILQREPCGNRALVCPYHGWRYDAEGRAAGIPSRARFGDLGGEAADLLRLRSYAVGTCGQFVFVRIAETGPDLDAYLGDAGRVLGEISRGLGDRVDTLELNELTNWKVAVENTLEFYHVGLVHRGSFAKLGAVEREQHLQGTHSLANADLPEAADGRRRKLTQPLEGRPYACEGYVHQFVFPNLTVATTQGTSFSVQLFEPMAAGTTRFVSQVFATRGADGTTPATAGAIARQTAQFNRAVFAEDQTVCELVQRGLRETADQRRGVLSDEEGRVLAFQTNYLRAMQEVAP